LRYTVFAHTRSLPYTLLHPATSIPFYLPRHLHLFTLRLSTLRLSTLRLSTLRLSTLRLSTLRLSAMLDVYFLDIPVPTPMPAAYLCYLLDK